MSPRFEVFRRNGKSYMAATLRIHASGYNPAGQANIIERAAAPEQKQDLRRFHIQRAQPLALGQHLKSEQFSIETGRTLYVFDDERGFQHPADGRTAELMVSRVDRIKHRFTLLPDRPPSRARTPWGAAPAKALSCLINFRLFGRGHESLRQEASPHATIRGCTL